jgi:AraC-like DNA-binding protein
MLLLDTLRIPPEQRMDAVNRAVVEVSAPCTVTHEVQDGASVDARLDRWRLGAVTLVTAESTGIRLRREARHTGMAGPAVVVLATQPRGRGRFEQYGRRQSVESADMVLTDLTAPYEFAWQGYGAAQAVLVRHATLGLPPQTVRRAARRLRESPLHDLVLHHVAELFRAADRAALDAAGAAVGAATAELVRALIVSAAGFEERAPDPAETVILERALDHIHAHLTDPGLSPAGIAAAQNVSVRYLYRICRDAGISLEQWIILRRLEGARRTLVSAAGRSRTVASVARSWGFADPSHFARRFRSAYGISPRAWQRGDDPGGGGGPAGAGASP